MKRKKVRSAKTLKRAVQPRRSPRKTSAKTKPSGRKRLVAKPKAIRKKSVSKSPRVRKAPPSIPKTKRTRKPARAPQAAEPLAVGFKELALVPTIAAGTAAPVQLPPTKGAAGVGQRPAPAVPAFPIPPILLEGDEPLRPRSTGPAEKYALGPSPPAPSLDLGEGELPESYGTGKLFLAARDPHCLYAQWDLTESQQRQYNARSTVQHLLLRVYRDIIAGEPATEAHLLPESRHSFQRAEWAGARYLAQLGYYQAGGEWVAVATSEAVTTPPEAPDEDMTLRWGTVPVLVPHVKSAATLPEVPALERAQMPAASQPREEQAAFAPPTERGKVEPLRVESHPSQAGAMAEAPPRWTPAHQQALSEMVKMALAQQPRTGSAEIAELVGQHARLEFPAPAAQLGLAAPSGLPLSLPNPLGAEALSISSPTAGPQAAPRKFWFNVNAELIIYGATEPDARVTIGGRPLGLRPDGTFSCRFALPDGHYELPVAAVSAHEETRRAELAFSRRTEYQGEVGAHPQDQALRPPAPENAHLQS